MGPAVKHKLAFEISCLGPVGRLPVAPGTWGSLVAAIAAPWLFMPFSLVGRLLLLLVIFIGGALTSSAAEKVAGKKDPQCVIIDEVAGQWITYLPFPYLNMWALTGGFLLFRIFDILKPWPVRHAENWLPSGWGIMIDDVFAGLYGLITLGAILYLFG